MADRFGIYVDVDGDNSGAKAAIQETISLVDQYGRAVSSVGNSEVAAKARQTRAWNNLRKAIDPAYAGQLKFDKGLKVLNAQFVGAARNSEEYARTLDLMKVKYLGAEAAADNYNRQIRVSRFHTANLAAQFNDIGVMMAAGQSPLLLAVQQGSQLNQVFHSMGGGRSALLGVAQGIKAIVSPMSLLTIGTVAAVAAGGQWVMSLWKEEEQLEKNKTAMEAYTGVVSEVKSAVDFAGTSIKELTKTYGDQAKAAQETALTLAKIEALQAQTKVAAAAAEVEEAQNTTKALVEEYKKRLDEEQKITQSAAKLRDFDSAAAKAATKLREDAQKALTDATGLTVAENERLLEVIETLQKEMESGTLTNAFRDASAEAANILKNSTSTDATLLNLLEKANQFKLTEAEIANLTKLIDSGTEGIQKHMESTSASTDEVKEKLNSSYSSISKMNTSAFWKKWSKSEENARKMAEAALAVSGNINDLTPEAQKLLGYFDAAAEHVGDMEDRLELAKDWGIQLNSIADAMRFNKAIEDASVLAEKLKLGAGWASAIAGFLGKLQALSMDSLSTVPQLGPGESGMFQIQDYINNPTFERGVNPGVRPKAVPNNIDAGLPPLSSGGGGGGTDAQLAQLEQLQEFLSTEVELERAQYEERQALLEEALEKKRITQEQYNEMSTQLQKEHAAKLAALDVYRYGTTLDKAQTFFGDMANAFASGNEEMLQIGKAFGAAEAIVNAWRTFGQVMSDPTLSVWQKLPMALAAFGQAVKAVQGIRSVSSSGSGSTSVSATSASATDAGSVAPTEVAPTYNRSITLLGNNFNRAQVSELAEFMNEGSTNGIIIRGSAR